MAIEQPELHLHPTLQSNLTDLIIWSSKINNNLSNEFLIQYNISPREEMTILKELIQYLLESNFESGQMARNRHMNSRVNYVMKTSSKKSEDDLYEMLETYKRFYV